MKEQDFSKMSRAEILTMMTALQEQADRKREERRSELKEEIQRLLQEDGFTLEDIFGGRGDKQGKTPRKLRGAATVRYADPQNPENTWTGRGRKPNWLTGALDAGMAMDDFVVQE